MHLRASQVNKDWVSTYYSEVIKQTLKELNLPNYRLDWEVEETEMHEEDFADEDDAEFFFEKQNTLTNRNSNFNIFRKTATGSSGQKQTRPILSTSSRLKIRSIRNTRSRTFVVGSCNQFAHAASSRPCRIAGQNLQSFVYIRRCRAWQNASDARHRSLDQRAKPSFARRIYFGRKVYERID